MARFCLVPIQPPRCRFCNEVLPWQKRSDAIYCKPSCRQAGHHASRLNPEVVAKILITSPLLDCPIHMDVWQMTWSSATKCDLCERFITMGFGMAFYWGDVGAFGCSWKCLQILSDRPQFRAE
jgi:hypothetical protein